MTTPTGKFYLIYGDLLKLADAQESEAVSTDEMDEIDRIRQLVSDVSADRPQFCTST